MGWTYVHYITKIYFGLQKYESCYKEHWREDLKLDPTSLSYIVQFSQHV